MQNIRGSELPEIGRLDGNTISCGARHEFLWGHPIKVSNPKSIVNLKPMPIFHPLSVNK